MTSRACFPLPGVVYRSAAEADAFYASGDWVHATAGDVLRRAAAEVGSKTYLIGDATRLTFADVNRQSESLAASLLAMGLKPGDRAIFQMGVVPEIVVALLGCYKAGVIPVCTLPQYREIEIGQLASMSAAKAYFVQGDFSPSFDLTAFARQMMASHPSLKHLIVSRGAADHGAHDMATLCNAFTLDDATKRVSAIKIDPEDVLNFQLSGGSTGVPKIIPRMHGEYLGQALGWAKLHAYGQEEIAIWPLPIIHNAGMLLIMLGSLLNRSTAVLQERFDLEAFLTGIRTHRVTYAASIGPIAPRLLDYKDLDRHDLSSLRMFVGMDRAGAIEGHVGVTAMNLYGITEGLLMSSAPSDPVSARFMTNGRPTSPRDDIRILEFGTEAPVKPGEQGELCFRGPYSLSAYYNAAADVNAASFTSDGYVRTSDIVKAVEIDGHTYYIYLGRMKDNISRGNEKFAAEEVEVLAVLHPDVLDVKIVAMPDRYLGERACAFVIVRPGRPCPSVAELGAFLVGKGLAKFKLPERIEQVTEFPVTRVGKLDRQTLRQTIATKVLAETQPEHAAN